MLRLLIDENVNHRILRGLKVRLPQIDYVLVKQIAMSGSPDLELLRWAARENRILVTHDKKTMTRWVQYCLERRERIAGVIIIPKRMAIGRAVRDLELMLECFSPAELTGQIKYLPL